ncbi:coumaroyl-CoA:anthocyanidin 3-O-glucoside-6''-O-coumaroyltransferase 2-like [Panicum hallii]|nr:coumaroyl-CoA:anthocyanidin 3-O-glucoside-6''-O-coumaroyltransferase 2-like [Panicum hallii]
MAPPSSSPGVRVVDRIRVSPPPPSNSAREPALPLTFFDVAWLFTGPVERLFFFRHPDPASVLPLLRSSLSVTLRRFYPLAGTIRPHPPFLCSYTPGADALTLVVAESDSPDDFDRLVARSPRDLAGIRPLVPQLPPPGEDGAFSLAAVQATVFPGRGICLGVSVHHAACDDTSTMHFVRTWAAACRLGLESDDGSEDAALPPPPVLYRSLVADPDDLRGKTLAGMARLAPPPPPQEEEEEEKAPMVMASFLLPRHQIDRIKEGAAAKSDAKPSSFVAASALAWVCLLKSGSSGVAGAGRSHMLFSAECRTRLTPPLPAEYFGNCLRPCFVEAATADLLSGETADGVAAAASAIRSAIREMEQGVLEGAEGWLGRVLSVLPERPMSVGGSPRHGVYETADFGWGRPARVEMVSVEKTPGTVALADSPEGDGGIELGVVLPTDAMDAFASCFADALGGATI